MVFNDKVRKETGRMGEAIAAQFLQSKGFTILECNHRQVWGEIDIIAIKNNVVRFVEVKTLSRENNSDITREMSDYRPEEQVHQHKLRKIARTAEVYMNSKKDDRDFQIDVVGVLLEKQTRRARCRLYEQVL